MIADAEDGADADPGLAASLAHAWFILDWALYDVGRPEEATHSARRARDLRAARRPRPPGRGAQQPRRVRLLRGPLARRRRALPARRRGVRARGRHGQRRLRRLQHRRGAQRPGPARGGAPTSCAARCGSGAGRSTTGATAFATTLLGRAAVRAGRHAEGLDLLEQGLNDFQRLRALPDAGLAEAYTAEGLAFAGRPDAALLAADRALRDATRTAPLLHRVRGFALAQLGDEDGAAARAPRVAARRGGARRTSTRSPSPSTRSRRWAARRPAAPRGARRCWSSSASRRCRRPPVSPASRDRRPAAAR